MVVCHTPHMHEGVIQNQQGKSFQVLVGWGAELWGFDVKDGRYTVGYASCALLDGTTLRLDDLYIRDVNDFDKIVGPVEIGIQRHRHGRLRGYRGSGLGTAFLTFIVEIARRQGIQRIEGTVHPDRSEDSERLLRWYQKMGFTIKPADKTKLATSIAEFELVLG